MRYILCEDTGSGFKFFESVRDAYGFDDSTCKVISSNGNQQYQDCMTALLGTLNSGDKLLLAFDNIGIVDNFNPKTIVALATNKCKQLGVDLWYTSFYCFEELFLSYKELKHLCSSIKGKDAELQTMLVALSHVNTCIFSSTEYYDRETSCISDVIKIAPKAGKNKEHFCSELLRRLTARLRAEKMGVFYISKSVLGKCWLDSCTSIRLGTRCSDCISNLKDKDAKDKVLYMECNSCTRLHNSFSVFFE